MPKPQAESSSALISESNTRLHLSHHPLQVLLPFLARLKRGPRRTVLQHRGEGAVSL